MKLDEVERYCSLPDPYVSSEEDTATFLRCMAEIHTWHFERSAFYREFSKQRGLEARLSFQSTGDLVRLPLVPAEFFKTHEVLSIPREDVFLHLTSSGTSGQKSQIFFDKRSIESAQGMIDRIFDFYAWRSEKSCDYFLLSYESEATAKLGTSYTDNFLCKYAPARRSFTALRSDGQGSFDFDVWGGIRFLEEAAEAKQSVRIFGFPAFLYFLVNRMRQRQMTPFQLGPESLVFLGGGWKKHSGEEIPRIEFRALVSEFLGIPDERIRDGYGSVEHCVPYIECPRHHFHLPRWSRVLIRSFENLEPLGYGMLGFLQFFSPYITSVPAHAVMMGDAASLHPGSECGCGVGTEYFVLKGRAGQQKNKSCAMAAADLLKRVGA